MYVAIASRRNRTYPDFPISSQGLSSALAVLRTGLGDLPSDIDVEMVMLEPEDEKELDQAIINAFF